MHQAKNIVHEKGGIPLEKEQCVSIFPSNSPNPPLKKRERGISPFSKGGLRGITAGLLFFTVYTFTLSYLWQRLLNLYTKNPLASILLNQTYDNEG
ncbi:MAG: hypothetical protein DWB56_13705 [Candidatus Jettenia sp.]|nr:MAG: hypothetical protein EDM77_12645 [Candidatus Jettenia sp. AMX1]MBC6929990.1 hypothetical protein [Candidatus Jettenia sp.]MCE7881639.1 hypothetical protein [Candidatus Jettenia sp. AMX1]MCQ3928270.1 hypothetical protein [Candidatus Jettenia sp.]GJQ45113.1 MAG: hypothetical protein JETCAE04_08670 [Candidatus Jettenia caeni]